MNEIGKTSESSTLHCPMCDCNSIVTSHEKESFEYGAGKESVKLHAYIPVSKCESCGYEFVGEKADEIRYDAICDHLRLLRPNKIQEIRVRLAGSQKGFSEFTHLGQASIQRWENRQVLQSASNDLYLRLLEFPENFERLTRWNRGEEMNKKETQSGSDFKGCALAPNEIEQLSPISKSFLLRKVG